MNRSPLVLNFKLQQVLNNTWNEAFSFDLSGVAEAYSAVRMRESQESLAKVINPLVQFIRNVGCLEFEKNTHK